MHAPPSHSRIAHDSVLDGEHWQTLLPKWRRRRAEVGQRTTESRCRGDDSAARAADRLTWRRGRKGHVDPTFSGLSFSASFFSVFSFSTCLFFHSPRLLPVHRLLKRVVRLDLLAHWVWESCLRLRCRGRSYTECCVCVTARSKSSHCMCKRRQFGSALRRGCRLCSRG